MADFLVGIGLFALAIFYLSGLRRICELANMAMDADLDRHNEKGDDDE